MDEKQLAEIAYIENIDGQDLYVVNSEMVQELDELYKIAVTGNDYTISSITKKRVSFIKKHVNFGIAFRPFNLKKKTMWLPCIIYKLNDNWRRVQLQLVHCLNCSWEGKAANPTSPELYELMNNDFEVLEKMWKLPFCVCPKCGGKLSTQAIWIEGIESEEDLKK